MIDIDEAIRTYAHNAEYERMNGNLQGCLGFRLLTEWLKDYKRLLEHEPKTAHREYNDIFDLYRCEDCKHIVQVYDNYCPNCGAKMIKERDDV